MPLRLSFSRNLNAEEGNTNQHTSMAEIELSTEKWPKIKPNLSYESDLSGNQQPHPENFMCDSSDIFGLVV